MLCFWCNCVCVWGGSLASHTLLAKNKAEGSGDRAYNVSFHSPCIGGETYFMCTCYKWMSQVVVRVVELAMERVPEIVMVAIVCQSLNPSQKQVHMRYVSPPIHGEWNETLYARSPDPSALFFARRVWLARLGGGVECVVIGFSLGNVQESLMTRVTSTNFLAYKTLNVLKH